MSTPEYIESEKLQSVLADVDKTGVYHMPHVDPGPMIAAAEANGFGIFRVDLSTAKTKEEMLSAIGRAMSFPDWAGHGFDALNDCLNDLGWRPAEGYMVMLDHCDGIHGHAESDFVTLLQVFEGAALEWREQGVPFWCFVDMQADGINWLPDVE